MGVRKLCSVLLMGMLILSISGCSASDINQSQVKEYPIASGVSTTLQRTILLDAIPAGSAKLLPSDIAKFKENGYGAWRYGPGIAAAKQLDIMPSSYNGASVTQSAKLLRFFTVTDIHLTDEEAPAQLIAG